MFTDSFDARSVQPSQGFDVHPPGMFDATISNTYAKPTASGTGGRFVVEYTTPAGRIENGYNIWNESPKAVEIAQKELSALCHATGIYKISFPKDQSGNPILDRAGFELRGGRLKIEVAPQTQKDGSPHPNGYMEVKKVYDASGNEPGKSSVASQPMQAAPQQTAPQAPMQQQPNGGWAQQVSIGTAQGPNPNQGWQQQPAGNVASPPNGNPPWGAQR